MSNIYILGAFNTPPPPWLRQTGFDGLYLRCARNFGLRQGSAQHTHPDSQFSAQSCTFKDDSNKRWEYSFNPIIPVHTHNVSSAAVVPSDNEPLFYNLSLWYMDYAEWFENVKSFPPNTIVLTKGSLNWDEVQLFDAPNGRYIRLGNVGLLGGSNTHLHGLTGQLDNITLTAQQAGSGPDLPELAINIPIHKHIFEGNTNLATSEPIHVICPLYIAKSGTTKALAGVICFTDDPVCPDKWSLATDLFDNLVLAGDSFSSSTGANVHTHTPSGSPSSSVTTSSAFSLQSTGTPIKFQNVPLSHNHVVDTSVSESAHVPPCITLIPMQLTQTIAKFSTYNKSALMSFGVKKSVPQDYVMTLPKKKSLSNTFPVSSSVRKFDIDEFLDVRLSTKYTKLLGCDYDFFAAKENYLGYSLDALLVFTNHEFAVSMRLLNSWLPQGEPVLDAIMKGWVDQIQKVDNEIQVMYLNSSLDYAIGTDLDVNQLRIYHGDPDQEDDYTLGGPFVEEAGTHFTWVGETCHNRGKYVPSGYYVRGISYDMDFGIKPIYSLPYSMDVALINYQTIVHDYTMDFVTYHTNTKPTVFDTLLSRRAPKTQFFYTTLKNITDLSYTGKCGLAVYIEYPVPVNSIFQAVKSIEGQFNLLNRGEIEKTYTMSVILVTKHDWSARFEKYMPQYPYMDFPQLDYDVLNTRKNSVL